MPGLLSRSLTSFHRFALRRDRSTTSSAALFLSFVLFSRRPASTFS